MVLIGQMILAVGFGLLLNPDLLGLPFYAALGLFVGVLRLIAGRWGTLSVALPVMAAFLVTVLAVEGRRAVRATTTRSGWWCRP